ncbi:MAG: D-hexose-6-phosphate mutarotase [Formivibrio sp.]|nr:D-hexose-6-phosphate mutarotase [Formivibrio sp.]
MSDQITQFAQTAGVRLVNSTELYPELHQPGDVGLPMLIVENDLGRAVIALQGAHLMAFQPAGKREMFWVSPKCMLEAGKPIRGGIPLCLPWFGPGADGTTPHGFARLMPWSLVAAEICEDGATRVVLELTGDASIGGANWPHAFCFRMDVVVSSKLELALAAENLSNEAAPFAFAFHTYFAVPNVAEARISGLDGATYIDKMDNFARKQQQGDVAISAVTDCIYLDVAAEQTLKTAAGDVKIESDAKCAVVWNAWTNDKNIADLGEGNHVGYLCVERCDVADRAITLPAGGTYQTWMMLSY